MANNLKRYGLIGKDIGYSFSRGYFKEKFETLDLQEHRYENFDLQKIDEFKRLITNNDNLYGLNVTIPYKQEVIPYLNELSEQATEIGGAVNTIQFTSNGLVGHNTDAYGFKNALLPFLKPHHKNALILGTGGGASKAVRYVLHELGLTTRFVSRKSDENKFSYEDLDEEIISEHTVIINCTPPLGTHPNIEVKPLYPTSLSVRNTYCSI